MNIAELKKQITDREEKIATLESAKTSAASVIEKLTIERKSLIVPARAEKDQAAAARLSEIDQKIAKARQGMEDDAAAIDALNKEMEPFKKQLHSAEQEQKRENCARLLTKAVERAIANEQLCDQFLQGVNESIADAHRIAACLRELDHGPMLSGNATQSLHVNIIGVMKSGHAESSTIDVPKALSYFTGALDGIARQI